VPTNRYGEVAEVLRREIHDGTYPQGTTLPTLPNLRQRFEASNSTIRSAIDLLVREGLVYTAGRKGTIVRTNRVLDHDATRPLRNSRPRSGQDVFTETVERAGRSSRKTFEMRIAVAPDDVTERLGIERGSLTVIRELVQYVDDEAWMHEMSYYPRAIAEQVGLDVPHDISQGTMRALRDAGYIETGWRDEVAARAPTPDEAQLLDMATGVALMVHTRTAATDECVTRVTRAYRPGDRVRIIHELGADSGIDTITATLAASAETEQ